MQNHAFYENNIFYFKKNCFRCTSRHAFRRTISGSFVSKCSLYRSAIGFLLAACFMLVALLLFAPQTAFAKSYDMPNVSINAQIQTNGDLQVVEQRQFDFNGSFSAVWWNYNGLPSGAQLSIDSVRMVHVDDSGAVQNDWTTLSSVPFQLDWREEGGPGNISYSFDEPEDTVYAFFNETDSSVVFELTYTIKDAVQAYSDVGELYWKFIGSEWEGDSSNVSFVVSLPVPSGATIEAGENVRAWGHGPLDAKVTINPDGTVTYEIPQVNAGSYAEARILFPTEWLSDVMAKDNNAHFSTANLDTALNEERTWADRANADRVGTLALMFVVVLACLVLLVWAFRSFIKYGKELKPQFTDEYWRDVPLEGEHPSVIGRLCRFNKESTTDFTATIMHLANLGAVQINEGTYQQKGVLGSKTVEDYYLTRVPDVELNLNSEIDRKAMTILFDEIAGGESSLWLGTVKEYAEEHPKSFSDLMMRWQGIVTAHVSAGEYFESYSCVKRTRMSFAAVVLIAVCVVLAFLFNNIFVIIPGVITGIVLMVVSRFMDRRTQKGADVYARCEALKKWLTEFSALNERPPMDVKVWGEFMVYALVFGVAEKAMEELRKAVPEAVEGDYSFMGVYNTTPWWIWYSAGYSASSLPDLGTAFENVVSSSVSTSASAISGNMSSAGGFGGGFSGGGGGGFGGGGGAR